MSCDKTQMLIESIWYEELDEKSTLYLEKHIKVCPKCSANFSDTQNNVRLIQKSLKSIKKEIKNPQKAIWDKISSPSPVQIARIFPPKNSIPSHKRWIDIFEFPKPMPVVMVLSIFVIILGLTSYLEWIALEKYRKGQANLHMEILTQGVLNYYERYHCYPPNGDEETTLFLYLSGKSPENNESIEMIPMKYFCIQNGKILDPWGFPYRYKQQGEGFTIFSNSSHNDRDYWIGRNPNK